MRGTNWGGEKVGLRGQDCVIREQKPTNLAIEAAKTLYNYWVKPYFSLTGSLTFSVREERTQAAEEARGALRAAEGSKEPRPGHLGMGKSFSCPLLHGELLSS